MTTPKMTTPKPLVTIKQYADRRLYQPDAGSYVSLGDLATSLLLKQIIVERAHHG
jgi:polyhydroxyalkanoate synthesis regulator protein